MLFSSRNWWMAIVVLSLAAGCAHVPRSDSEEVANALSSAEAHGETATAEPQNLSANAPSAETTLASTDNHPANGAAAQASQTAGQLTQAAGHTPVASSPQLEAFFREIQVHTLPPDEQARMRELFGQASPEHWPWMMNIHRLAHTKRRGEVNTSVAMPPPTLTATARPAPTNSTLPPLRTTEPPQPAIAPIIATSPAVPAPAALPLQAAALANFDGVESPAPTLSGLIRNLEQASQDTAQVDDRLAMQRELRFLYLLSGQRDKALEPITGLDSREQEFLANELYALSLYLDEHRNPDRQRRAAEAVVPHREAAIKLSEQASLRVHNLAFCTEVNSYGVYTRFSKERFHPGQQVLLYAEVENFISERTPRGHHTRLEGSFQIFDNRNDQRAEKRFPVAEEHCHNRRRDYFVRYFLEVPRDLPDGRYTLKLTIEDLLGKKVGESSIEFEVARRASG